MALEGIIAESSGTETRLSALDVAFKPRTESEVMESLRECAGVCSVICASVFAVDTLDELPHPLRIPRFFRLVDVLLPGFDGSGGETEMVDFILGWSKWNGSDPESMRR